MNEVQMSKLDFAGYMEAVKEDERNRMIQIVSKFITTACICDRCQTARAILDAVKGENK